MFEALAEKIVCKLISKRIILDEYKELYQYGFNAGLTVLFNILSTIIVGAFFGMVFECLVFLIGYIPLRSYGGGYHAQTPLRCYFISIFMIILILEFLSYFSVASIYVVLLLVGTTVFLILSPVEDKNKPLDDKEISVYRKKSCIVLTSEICIWVIISLIGHRIEKIIPLIIFTEAILLIAGKIKNSFITAAEK